MILLRKEFRYPYEGLEWQTICHTVSFHHVTDGPPRRAAGDLLLEFLRRPPPTMFDGKWTKYRLYFDPNDVIRLEHVLEINALDGLKKYGDLS